MSISQRRPEEKVLGDVDAKRAQGGVDGFVIWKIRTVGRRLRVLTLLAGAACTCQWYAAGDVQEYPRSRESVQIAMSRSSDLVSPFPM